ncbi:MAG: pilus assembly protein [bacterium]
MKNKVTNNIKTFMPFLQDIFMLLLFISIINIGLAYITGMQNIKSAYAADTSFLTNVNNPNVLIFLDTSGSMMWNEGVNWSNTTTGESGYDAPESWADGGASPVWAPGSNSVFSKIYNAKMAISQIVQDPSFSNLNYAFATFDQIPSPNDGAKQAHACVYAYGPSPYDGLTFTNPAANAAYYSGNHAYYPGNPGGPGTPDHSGAYLINNNFNSEYPFEGAKGPYNNGIFPCSGPSNLDASGNPTTNLNDITWYFISYDYSFYIGDDDNSDSLSNWRLYVPLTVNGTLNTTTSETVSSNSNNSTDPYFDSADIAGPAIKYVLWNAHDYGGLTDPAGNVVSGIKAGGGTPMYSMVENMTTYFTNSLSADSAKACRRNFSIIITDGEANGYKASDTPKALYNLYTNVDATYPIQTFMIGFGYSGGISGPVYIQGMANAGAGINPSVNPAGVSFNAGVGSSSTTLVLPSSAFSSTNGVLVGDTISDNGNESDDCESANNNSGVYANGNNCATVTGIYPSSDEVLLSNRLNTLSASGNSGTITVSGTVYLAFNLNELESSLTTIFNQIEKQTSSFTSPVVNETSNQQYVYYANFKSLNQPLWGEGNIYLFGLNSKGELTGPNGLAVTNGQINTSDSYWDNGNGAGGLLQSEPASSRDVLTSYLNPSTGTQQTIAINPVSTSSSNSDLDNLLNINSTTTSPDYYGTVCPGSTSVSACAADILNFVLNPDSSTDNWKLGAIFHSTPILIGPPPFPYSSSSYQAFKQEYAVTNPRNEVLYAGANDGMLHAFNAGSWDTSTNSYTYGTGAEVFGYIPPNLLPKITSWYDSSIGVGTKLNFPEFVDSTPAASDVFFSNIFNGTVNSVDNSNYPLNQSSLQNSWHSVLMGGERNGGNYYYALGVTNPSSSSYPDPLWNITDSSMGNTWSKPNISYVCLPNPDYAANNGESGVCGNNPDPASPLLPPQYIKTYAAFIGGGYSSNNSLGNALYSLYVEPNPVNTGTSAAPNYTDEQILWEFNSSNDANMKYSIPSAVTPVLSQNFRMEGFYVGDLGGQMWSVNIPDGLPPYAASGKSNWDVCRMFDSNASAANPLNIFFSPSTATDTLGNLWVFFGTGNRENLNEVITSRNNEFIAINTTPLGGPLTCPASGPINESDLVNQTGVSGSTTNLTAVNSADGWYITLSPGEKVTSAPTVYDGIVYFTTFTPSSVTNACGYGTSNLYAVSYLNGGGTILTSTSGTITIINNATASSGAAQSTVIGSGVASAPVISNNYLGITTSTGNVISQQIPAPPSKVTPTSWFQEP